MKHVHMVRNRVSTDIWVSLSDIGRQTQCEDKRSNRRLTDDLKEYTVNKMTK